MRKILVILMGLACGAVTAQGPEFIQQYTQRLGGWRDAYALQLRDLDKRAADFGLPRDDYIVALQNSDDAKARNEGDHLARLPGYYESLNAAYESLTEAGPVGRGFAFMEHYNNRLAKQVWASYKPALPANTEGAIYGGAGFVAGALSLFLVSLPFRLIRHARGTRGSVGLETGSGGVGRSGGAGNIVSRIAAPISRLRQRFSKKNKAD
jgi:hypothetical protein